MIAGEFAKDFYGNRLELIFKDSPVTTIPNADKHFNSYDIPEYIDTTKVDFSDIRLISMLSGEQSDNVRDYVSWLAEYMGGFVQANADGKMQFCLFENPWKDQPRTLDFSEFEQNTLEIAGFRIHLYSAKVILEDRQWRDCNWGMTSGNGIINVETIIQNNPFVEFVYQNYRPDMRSIVASLYYYQRNIQIRPFSGVYHGSEYLHSSGNPDYDGILWAGSGN